MKKRKNKDSEFIALYGIPVNKDNVKRQQEYDVYGPPIFNKKKAEENSDRVEYVYGPIPDIVKPNDAINKKFNDEDNLDTIEDEG